MVKRLFAALLIAVTFGSTLITVEAYNFEASDVPTNHPNYSAINNLIAEGIMQGYPDGRFRPNQPINRVEALKIVLRSLGTPCCTAAYQAQYTFRDTEPNAWYIPYLIEGTRQGIISGYSDGTFRPSQIITSPELIKMLVKAHYINIGTVDATVSPYRDVSLQSWYLPYMVYAKNRDILPQRDYVRPDKPLTRGEASELLYRFMLNLDSSNNPSYTSDQESESNMYSIPADIRPNPPIYGETEIRASIGTATPTPEQIRRVEAEVSSTYPQSPVVQNSPSYGYDTRTYDQNQGWNWWPVYNVSETLQNGVNTRFPDVLFGHVQFMNAWNMISNSVTELNKYTQDHVNYMYQYKDIAEPGEYIYTLE
ncbi:MAG: S-layer homology domain-containing protein [Candidatus Gracilibacteria bacterium]